jgi:hypothetical protein
VLGHPAEPRAVLKKVIAFASKVRDLYVETIEDRSTFLQLTCQRLLQVSSQLFKAMVLGGKLVALMSDLFQSGRSAMQFPGERLQLTSRLVESSIDTANQRHLAVKSELGQPGVSFRKERCRLNICGPGTEPMRGVDRNSWPLVGRAVPYKRTVSSEKDRRFFGGAADWFLRQAGGRFPPIFHVYTWFG